MGVVVSLGTRLPNGRAGYAQGGRVFWCSEMSASWAMSLPADGYARFHVIERGRAWLRMQSAK